MPPGNSLFSQQYYQECPAPYVTMEMAGTEEKTVESLKERTKWWPNEEYFI